MNRSSLLWMMGLATWAPSAFAGEPRASLDYVAPPACPSRDALVAGVRARTAAAEFSGENAPAHAFRVVVSPASRGFAATITMRDGTTTNAESIETRRLKGATCIEVVDATALVIALAIDPNASLHASIHAGSKITVDTPAIAPVPPASMPVASRLPDPVPVTEEAAVPPVPSSPASWSSFTFATLGSEIGTLPHPSARAAIGFGLERARGAFFSTFAIELSIATSDWAGTTDTGSYTRAMARLEACPWRVAAGDVFSARACAWFGAGALRAEATSAPIPVIKTIAWTDTGVCLHLRAAQKKVFFEIGAGAVVPLERPRFVLASPRVVLYETPAVGALLSMGAGVRFE